MGLFGGSSSSSQTLNNSISFNPVVNVGEGNDGSIDAQSRQEATSTASNKDEFGLSAGVAVGAGSSAMGGSVGVGDDVQPMPAQPARSGIGGDNALLYAGGGIALLALVYMAAKKG